MLVAWIKKKRAEAKGPTWDWYRAETAKPFKVPDPLPPGPIRPNPRATRVKGGGNPYAD